ncbi:AraC family transcriptional regulator [Pontiella agarivorans]|nr:helix-turn-helix domain-containing protein [Pontiella agarivorans]
MPVACEAEVLRLLRENGLQCAKLSDLSLPDIRHAQRGAFPDMRMAHLAAHLRDEFLSRPLTEDLLCTRVGFQGPSPAHYIPRPAGSYDHILIYCTEGRGWLDIDEQVRSVEKHEAFLIPAHIPHRYGADPERPWSNFWVHFQGRQAGAFARQIVPDPGNPVIHLPRHPEMIACIEQLYQFMSRVHTHQTLVAAGGALSQLLGVIQLHMHSSELRLRTADENLDKTVEFMHRNLSRKLGLKELAGIAGMSMNHYGALFRKRYSSTPIDYFNRLKIQRACELLVTTNLRVGEAGEQLGFPDPYYFSRLFKKIMGVAPRDYR